jgi:two-component system LytT family response regulator
MERIVIKIDGRMLFLNAHDIDLIKAAGNYVEIHSHGKKFLTRETMNGIESRLPAETFLRIHRSTIVNTSRIQEMQAWYHGEYQIKLSTGSVVYLSRGYRHQLRRLLL